MAWQVALQRLLFNAAILASLAPGVSCGGGKSSSGDGGETLPRYNQYWSVAAADLNGDGKLDIVVSYSIMSGSPPHAGVVAVYLQDSGKPGSFLSPATYNVGNDPVALAIGDLNNDGKLDIVTANTIMNSDGKGSSSVSVLLQDQAAPGHFLPAESFTTGFSPVQVAVGDLNGDGLIDIAVADTTGVSILLQSTAARGQFLPLKTLAIGSGGASAVAIADLNGDGTAELLATTATGVNVYSQDLASPGTFLPPTSYSAGAQPCFILVRDLNGDGLPDLAVANLGSADGATPASLSVLLQNPISPKTFLPATNYSSGLRSEGVAAADLDGDGRVDLAVANMGGYEGASVYIFLQSTAAAGTFQPGVKYAYASPAMLAVGDLNGDGKTDLVVAGIDLEIWFQDPAHRGTFLTPTILAAS